MEFKKKRLIQCFPKETHIRSRHRKNESVGIEKEDHYIMTKESIQQEDITFINTHEPNSI